MFSNTRRQPTNKARVITTTTTTTASTCTAPASTTPLPNTASTHTRPPPPKVPTTTIKVTTVKTKAHAPIKSSRPVPPTLTSTSSSTSLKRKALEASTTASPTKRSHHSPASASKPRPSSRSPAPKSTASSSSKGTTASRARASPAPRAKIRSGPVSSDSDEPRTGRGTTATVESSSEDESLAMFGRRDSGVVVKRDVSATEDGRVNAISAAQLVEGARSRFQHYFVDLSNPARTPLDWAGAADPQVTLEYPGEGAQEKYTLLAPNGEDEFDPIDRLITVIKLVIETFLTPQQSLTYFNHSASTSSFGAFLSAPSRSVTPALGSSPGPSTPTAATPGVPLIRALEKARAKKDGPGFLTEVERYNAGLRELKASGAVKENIARMEGVAEKVWTHVAQEVYERTVGPEIDKLSAYEPFTDYVYGELLPLFNSQIFKQTELGAKKIAKEGVATAELDPVFVDLGSGVGNVVIQAALATGAESWGFEYMEDAARLADKQVIEAEARFRMWGLKGGKMRTVKADFTNHPEVGPAMKRADVVLVNNEVFTAPLNERLSWLFLDLPSKAQIVSLKAFAAGFTISQYNCHSPLAIIDQGSEKRYRPKSVSWKAEGGTYFVAKVDRRPLEKFLERAEEKAREKEAGGGSPVKA